MTCVRQLVAVRSMKNPEVVPVRDPAPACACVVRGADSGGGVRARSGRGAAAHAAGEFAVDMDEAGGTGGAGGGEKKKKKKKKEKT